jgi:hypothetical protein
VNKAFVVDENQKWDETERKPDGGVFYPNR